MGEVAKVVCGPTGEELRVQHFHAPKQRLSKGEVRREGVVAGENNVNDVKEVASAALVSNGGR